MKKRLYLFDIDGTLMSPGPAARQSINRAIESEVGQWPDLQIIDVAGLTDPHIIRTALRKYGVDGDINGKVDLIINRYLTELKSAYPRSEQPFIFDDALVLLERVEAAGHATGILTGNVRMGAKIKLGRFGLFERFPFGVFGDDAEVRADLPWIARERAWDVYREPFRFEDMVIVGDTPNDARVAFESGARSIIVCRRPEWRAEIECAGADLIVDCLDDPEIRISF